MPAKKKIDGAKLISMVESGEHQKDIMQAFKFNTTAQFKSHLLDEYMKVGKVPEVKSGRLKKASGNAKEALVSKRGSVVISKAMIDEMGFGIGEKFTVRKTKSGISLRKVES